MRLVCSHLCQMVSHFRVASRHGESCQEAREEPKKRGEMVTGDMNTQTSTFYHGRVWPPFTFYHVCGVEGRASRWERSVTVRGGEGRRQEALDACRGDCQWPTTRTRDAGRRRLVPYCHLVGAQLPRHLFMRRRGNVVERVQELIPSMASKFKTIF